MRGQLLQVWCNIVATSKLINMVLQLQGNGTLWCILLQLWCMLLQYPPARWKIEIYYSHLRELWVEKVKRQGLCKYDSKLWMSWNMSSFDAAFKDFVSDQWQSTSICLVLSWKTGLDVMWIVAWLSQYKSTACGWEIERSKKSCLNQVNSVEMEAMARYYASTEDRETIVYFLDSQEMREWPKNMQYPVKYFLVSGQEAQSESQKPLRWSEDVEDKRIPCSGAFLIYLRILWAAARWVEDGWFKNWLRTWVG